MDINDETVYITPEDKSQKTDDSPIMVAPLKTNEDPPIIPGPRVNDTLVPPEPPRLIIPKDVVNETRLTRDPDEEKEWSSETEVELSPMEAMVNSLSDWDPEFKEIDYTPEPKEVNIGSPIVTDPEKDAHMPDVFPEIDLTDAHSSVAADAPVTHKDDQPGMEESSEEIDPLESVLSDEDYAQMYSDIAEQVQSEYSIQDGSEVKPTESSENVVVGGTPGEENIEVYDEEILDDSVEFDIKNSDIPESDVLDENPESSEETAEEDPVDILRNEMEAWEDSIIPSWNESIMDKTVLATILTDPELAKEQYSAVMIRDGIDNTSRQQMKANAIDTLDTFPNVLVRSVDQCSDQQKLDQEALDEILVDPTRRARLARAKKVSKDKIVGSLLLSPDKIKTPSKDLVLTGASSADTFLRYISTFIRVPLYNSGITLMLRPPTRAEMYSYNQACDIARYEFGRRFGLLSYIPHDVELKNAFMNMFEKLVTHANLENWKSPGVLRQAISFLDFDTLVWAVIVLIHPEGSDTTFVCNHKDCGKSDVQKVDLRKIIHHDFSKLGPDALNFVADSETVRTLDELTTYRTEYLRDYEVVPFPNNISVTIATPTIASWIEFGQQYVSDLSKVISIRDIKAVQEAFEYRFFRSLAAWIPEIRVAKSGGRSIVLKNPTAIPRVLDSLQADYASQEFKDTFDKIYKSKKISYIAFVYTECPHCHKQSDAVKNGMLAIDVHHHFFTVVTDCLRTR